jgi:hypothetical protein
MNQSAFAEYAERICAFDEDTEGSKHLKGFNAFVQNIQKDPERLR